MSQLGTRLKSLIRSTGREALILTVTVILVTIVQRALFHPGTRTTSSVQSADQVFVGVGDEVSLPNQGSVRSPTILLISSPDCPYCRASSAFHGDLFKSAKMHGIPMYVAVPKVQKAEGYLSSAGLSAAHKIEWHDLHVHIRGTPTLLMMDENRVVRRIWIGMVSKQRMSEILGLLADPQQLSRSGNRLDTGEENLTSSDLSRLEKTKPVTLLDVRDRDAAKTGSVVGSTIYIPLEELVERAPFELRRDRITVVDCSNLNLSTCENAVNRLDSAHFTVAALNAGMFNENACDQSPAKGL